MHILSDSLKRYDLSQIYILPSLREFWSSEKGR